MRFSPKMAKICRTIQRFNNQKVHRRWTSPILKTTEKSKKKSIRIRPSSGMIRRTHMEPLISRLVEILTSSMHHQYQQWLLLQTRRSKGSQVLMMVKTGGNLRTSMQSWTKWWPCNKMNHLIRTRGQLSLANLCKSHLFHRDVEEVLHSQLRMLQIEMQEYSSLALILVLAWAVLPVPEMLKLFTMGTRGRLHLSGIAS